jgi:universal stress protein A
MTMSYKNILCPIDLSPFNEEAIKIASAMAKSEGATLHFLYVALPILPPSSGMAIGEVEQTLIEERDAFEKIRPTTESVNFKHHFMRGELVHVIVDFIHDNKVDLVVMPTHGRTGLMRLLMGSVAEHVVRKAECPVLVVKAATKKA